MNEKRKDIESILKARIQRRVDQIDWSQYDIDKCYIGGNSCNRDTPKDFDLFPVTDNSFDVTNAEIIVQTKNAKTTTDGKYIVQLCDFQHKDLKTLVDSFDFAHIQVGALLEHVAEASFPKMVVQEVYFTEDWENSHLAETTWYIGSEYPLSSLLRLLKYHKRNYFAGNSHMVEVLSILQDFVKRGFGDYDDFKDQLDAIDLQLVADNDRLEDPFLNLFELMRRDK